MRRFADSETSRLETDSQAGQLAAALKGDPRCWIELDFSGVAAVGWGFALEFIRLADLEFPEVWLVPRCDGPGHAPLARLLVQRLARLREQAWNEACARLCGAGRPPRT